MIITTQIIQTHFIKEGKHDYLHEDALPIANE